MNSLRHTSIGLCEWCCIKPPSDQPLCHSHPADDQHKREGVPVVAVCCLPRCITAAASIHLLGIATSHPTPLPPPPPHPCLHCGRTSTGGVHGRLRQHPCQRALTSRFSTHQQVQHTSGVQDNAMHACKVPDMQGVMPRECAQPCLLA